MKQERSQVHEQLESSGTINFVTRQYTETEISETCNIDSNSGFQSSKDHNIMIKDDFFDNQMLTGRNKKSQKTTLEDIPESIKCSEQQLSDQLITELDV